MFIVSSVDRLSFFGTDRRLMVCCRCSGSGLLRSAIVCRFGLEYFVSSATLSTKAELLLFGDSLEWESRMVEFVSRFDKPLDCCDC